MEAGEKGHAQNHAGNPEQAAEQDNGEKDPEAGQAGGASQDHRTDHVAVQLLQYQHEQDKFHSFDGLDDQNEQAADDSADIRTEDRHDIGDADQYGDQQGIGRSQERRSDIAEKADDDGIDDLADQKTDKGLMDKTAVRNDLIGRLFLKYPVGDLFGAAGKMFL